MGLFRDLLGGTQADMIFTEELAEVFNIDWEDLGISELKINTKEAIINRIIIRIYEQAIDNAGMSKEDFIITANCMASSLVYKGENIYGALQLNNLRV